MLNKFFKISLCFLFVLTPIAGCKVPVSPYTCDNMPEELKDLPTTREYMYLVWRSPDSSMAEFNETLFGEVDSDAQNSAPDFPFTVKSDNSIQYFLQQSDAITEYKYSVLEPDVSSLNERPKQLDDGSILSAIISVSVASEEQAIEIGNEIASRSHQAAGYAVDRAIPVEYDLAWPVSDDSGALTPLSPGLQLASLIQKRDDLTQQEFLDLWHCADTPYAIDIHPHWRYERNVIVKPLSIDAPDYSGIVMLHARTDAEITDMNLFLGGNFLNGFSVEANVRRFLNIDTVNSNAMKERIFRSDKF